MVDVAGSVREDPLTGELVVIAPRRIPAPPAFARGTLPVVARCPFCPGAEHLTGATIAAIEDGGEWVARAFPNRRPALRPEEPDHPVGLAGLSGYTAVGAHEVLAESRDHDAVLDPRAALQLAADRTEDLRRDHRFAAVLWFRNRGVEAGSSQPHPHAQVMAVPVVPPRIERVFSTPHRVQQLLEVARDQDRVVWEDRGVVAFCPWAPSAAYEVWFAPTEPVPWLSLDPVRVEALADVLHAVERRLHGLFGYCAHNTTLYDAPNRAVPPGTSWHVRLQPRLVPIAGFERWSGGALNPIAPDASAAVLRGFVP